MAWLMDWSVASPLIGKSIYNEIKCFITVRGLLHTIFDDYYFMFRCHKKSYMHPDNNLICFDTKIVLLFYYNNGLSLVIQISF